MRICLRACVSSTAFIPKGSITSTTAPAMSFKGATRRSWCKRTPTCWSWRATWFSIRCGHEWLETRAILAAFGETESKAIERYAQFVAEGKGQPSPWEHLKNQVFLGSDTFVESLRRQMPQNRDLREVPQAKRRPRAKALPAYTREYVQRNDAIVAAYRSGGYTLRDIGDYFGLHYSRISKIVHAADLAAREEKGKIWVTWQCLPAVREPRKREALPSRA